MAARRRATPVMNFAIDPGRLADEIASRIAAVLGPKLDQIGTEGGNQPELLSLKRVSTEAQICLTSVRKEIRAGRLPIIKIGDRTLVRAVDFHRWIDSLSLGGSSNRRRDIGDVKAVPPLLPRPPSRAA